MSDVTLTRHELPFGVEGYTQSLVTRDSFRKQWDIYAATADRRSSSLDMYELVYFNNRTCSWMSMYRSLRSSSSAFFAAESLLLRSRTSVIAACAARS